MIDLLKDLMALTGGVTAVGGIFSMVLLWRVKKVKWKKLAIKVGDFVYSTMYQKIDNTKYEGPVVTLINFLEMVWERVKINDELYRDESNDNE